MRICTICILSVKGNSPNSKPCIPPYTSKIPRLIVVSDGQYIDIWANITPSHLPSPEQLLEQNPNINFNIYLLFMNSDLPIMSAHTYVR